jgi:hypothetical protein
MVEEKKTGYNKPEIKKERCKSYLIKNIGIGIATFNKPEKLKFLNVQAGKEITVSLTDNEFKELVFIKYRGKNLKRNDIFVEEIKTGAK